MLQSFVDALPEKIRCTNSFKEGTKFQDKKDALNCRYVEISQFVKKYIVIDIDRVGSAFDWYDLNLPQPSITTINPSNAHCHYCYELKTPVIYTEMGRRAPQKYFEAVDIALTNRLDGDKSYVGKFTKNPLHPSWNVIESKAIYDLEDFQEYIDLTSPRKIRLSVNGMGRNCTLFDSLRLWAYPAVKCHSIYEQYKSQLEDKGFEINSKFVSWNRGKLGAKEVLQIANSVAKWTWKRRFSIGRHINRGVMNFSSVMPLEQKQVASAYFSNEIRKNSTLQTILNSANALKSRGTPITQYSVSVHSKCSLPTIKRYWNEVDRQFNLYRHTTT